MSTLLVMWFRSANSHTGQRLGRITGRTDGSIRLLAKPHRYRLQPKGRPQMESGPFANMLALANRTVSRIRPTLSLGKVTELSLDAIADRSR